MNNSDFEQGIIKCAKEKGFSEGQAVKLAVLLPRRWGKLLPGKIMPSPIDPEINLRIHGIKPLSEMGQLTPGPSPTFKGFSPSFRSMPSYEEAVMPSPYQEAPLPSTWGKTSPVSMAEYQAELQLKGLKGKGSKPLSMIPRQSVRGNSLQQLAADQQINKGTINPPPTTNFPGEQLPIHSNVPVPPPPRRPIVQNNSSEFEPTQKIPYEQLLAQAQQMNKSSQINFPNFPQVLKPLLPKFPKPAAIPPPPVPKPASFSIAQQGMKDVNNPRLGGVPVQPSLSDQIRFNRQYSNN